MALTATATDTTRTVIITTMVISISPVKHNVVYAIAQKSEISATFEPLCNKLAMHRTEMGRVIIYCHTYGKVTSVYYFLKQRLGGNFSEPPNAPNLQSDIGWLACLLTVHIQDVRCILTLLRCYVTWTFELRPLSWVKSPFQWKGFPVAVFASDWYWVHWPSEPWTVVSCDFLVVRFIKSALS